MSSLPVLIEADPAAATASDPSLFSRERQTKFLAALAATGQVRSASARAGVSHQTAYRSRLASPGVRRAWGAAPLAARGQAGEVLACRGGGFGVNFLSTLPGALALPGAVVRAGPVTRSAVRPSPTR